MAATGIKLSFGIVDDKLQLEKSKCPYVESAINLISTLNIDNLTNGKYFVNINSYRFGVLRTIEELQNSLLIHTNIEIDTKDTYVIICQSPIYRMRIAIWLE